MVIGALLGAAAGLGQGLMQMGAQQDATELGYANLRFQRENAQRQWDLATASRPDVFGNELAFDEIMNEWDLNLTPAQEDLADAVEAEQYAGYREDAPMARQLRRRQNERSKQAFGDYNDRRVEYLYSPDQPESQESYVDDAMLDAALATDRVSRDRAGQLRTAALRMGQGADLDQLLGDLNTADIDQAMATASKAKASGRAAHTADVASWEGRHLPAMQMFTKIADDVGDKPPMPYETDDRMDNSQRAMAAAMSAALANESSQVGGAYSDLARLSSQSPDFSSMISALSGMKLGGGSPTTFTGQIQRPTGGLGLPAGDPWGGTEKANFNSWAPDSWWSPNNSSSPSQFYL